MQGNATYTLWLATKTGLVSCDFLCFIYHVLCSSIMKYNHALSTKNVSFIYKKL